MYLDDKHYAGDEDDPPPPNVPRPPPPGPPPGPGLTSVAVGASLLAIALLAAATKPHLRGPIVGVVSLLTGAWLLSRYLVRPRRLVDRQSPYSYMSERERAWERTKSNVVLDLFFGFFRAVFSIFTWGSKDD